MNGVDTEEDELSGIAIGNVELSILLCYIEILTVFSSAVPLVVSSIGVEKEVMLTFADEVEIRGDTELNSVSLLSTSGLPTEGCDG